MRTDHELNSLNVLARYRQCARAITLSNTGFELIVTLATHDKGWSVNSLAESLGVSRATIYSRLRVLDTAGFGIRDDAGLWTLNAGGRDFIRTFMTEAREIVRGRQTGFSGKIIRILDRIEDPERRVQAIEGARAIRFKQISEYEL